MNSYRHAATVAAFSLLASCGWNYPTGERRSVGELWDAEMPVAAADGLYVRLPHRGRLVLVSPDGSWAKVDVGGDQVADVSASADGVHVAAFVDHYRCELEDPRELRKVDFVSDCPLDARTVERRLLPLEAGVAGAALDVPGHHNALVWGPDGSTAVAWLDATVESRLEGVVDLSSIAVLDLDAGTTELVDVGFAPGGLMFTDDGSRLIVLSRSEVAVIDLSQSPPAREVSFPLTLDPDVLVEPVGVALTPDQRFALISVRGSSDLYILDLDNHSVNLVGLAAAPSDMLVDAETDQTVFVYEDRDRVDVLEHQLFTFESIQLDVGMSEILDAGDSVVLYKPKNGEKDAYKLELDTLRLWEYRLENPPFEMQIAPGQEFAVALTRAESGFSDGVDAIYDDSPGFEVLDLRADETGDVDTDTHPLILEMPAVGLAFASSDTALEAMVLQQGVEYLFAIDLYTGQQRELEMEGSPIALGALPAGPFWITHDLMLGGVGFVDPLGSEVVNSTGFAEVGLFEPRPIDTEGGE